MKNGLRCGLVFSLAAIVPVIAAPSGRPGYLQNLGCALEGGFRSIDGNTSTSVTFINQSGISVRTYWLDYGGKRVFYNNIAPGRQYTQQTYVTHPWVIASERSGECVALFQPAPSSSTAVIR